MDSGRRGDLEYFSSLCGEDEFVDKTSRMVNKIAFHE
jgi:hypothetical protein